MKKYLILTIIVLVVALIATIAQIRQERKKYEVAMENVKAADIELSGKEGKIKTYKLTVNQLKYYQDSILRKLDETRKELKIKDKNLKTLQYISSSYSRVDTFELKDTIFKEPSLRIDTLISDEWYQLRLGLKYPSMIAVTPIFKSEKHIIVSSKKETVNPPKKFFLLRWFQRKHTVLNIDVVEKSPYIQDNKNKYIEIIK